MKKSLLAAALFAVGCHSPTSSTVADRPESRDLSLQVNVRSVDGNSVNDLTIQLNGVNGNTSGLTYAASLANSTFLLPAIRPGIYRSVISGNGIVERTDEAIDFQSSPVSISVLKWNESIKGVRYDDNFHEFFNRIARANGYVRKWDLERKPPREIYIVADDVLPETVDRVKGLFEEFAATNANHYFDRYLGLPVITGPETNDVDGRLLVKFDPDMNPAWFGTAGTYQRNGRTTGCLINLNKKYLEERRFPNYEVGLVNHESGHCVFMSHTSENDGRFEGESVMSGAQQPTPYDFAAAAIVYRHTGFGNRSPDINPPLVSASSIDFEDVCKYRKPNSHY